MTDSKDPYDILGIAPGVSYDIGAKAHLDLSFKYHPDLNPGNAKAAQEFAIIQVAWEKIKYVLPKKRSGPQDALPNPSDPDFVKKYEELVAQWLAADDDTPRAKTREPEQGFAKSSTDPLRQEFDEVNWSTVGKSAGALNGPRLALPAPAPKTTKRLSLQHITSKEATYLIESYPTVMAALKILQQVKPEYALYDAILSKAQPHKAVSASNSKALSIIVDTPVDKSACDAALKDPMASLLAVKANAQALTKYIIMGTAPLTAESLLMKLGWMKEHIKTIAQEVQDPPAASATARLSSSIGKWLGGKG